MRDFLRFIHQLWLILYFLRGVILTLLVLLLTCAAVVAIAEEMPVGMSLYFMLVTALTIGYGDIIPVTFWGRLASLAGGIAGVLSMGIVIAVANRALERAYREKIETHRRKNS